MDTKEVISEDQKAIARFAKAMGHPVRLYVLEVLSKQSCCYSGDLTDVLPIAKSTLSQHLKELIFKNYKLPVLYCEHFKCLFC